MHDLHNVWLPRQRYCHENLDDFSILNIQHKNLRVGHPASSVDYFLT